MNSIIEQNKTTVQRFNKEVIEQGSPDAFHELVAPNCINHAAPKGAPNGPESMIHFLMQVLKPAFSEKKVVIHDQVGEGDSVVTRKTIHCVHTGELMGIPASGKKIAIEVIDIIRLENGKYAEHWGISNFQSVVASLQ